MRNPVQIREARLTDVEAIRHLISTFGMTSRNLNPKFLRRYLELASEQHSSFGWILENQNQDIVGVFLNFRTRYKMGAHEFRVAMASTWAVLDEYRSQSLRLLSKFNNQADIDLLVDGTATKEVGLILNKFRYKQAASSNYLSHLWIINVYPVAESLAFKLLSRPSRVLTFLFASLLFAYQSSLRLFDSFHFKKNNLVSELQDVDCELDDIFFDKNDSPLFSPVRNTDIIRWRFFMKDTVSQTRCFVFKRNKRVCGYLICNKIIGEGARALTKLNILDIQVLENDKEIVRALVDKAIEVAIEMNVDCIEMMGFSDYVDLLRFFSRPVRRKLNHSPFYFRFVNHDLERKIRIGKNWILSNYDSDASIR